MQLPREFFSDKKARKAIKNFARGPIFLFFIMESGETAHLGGKNIAMKTTLRLPALLAAFLLIPVSCQDLFRPGRTGTLLIGLSADITSVTRSAGEIPDSGEFLLDITDAGGGIIYRGPYAQSPDVLTLPAGSYTVSAASAEFERPTFDAPLWGDTQVVTVPAGASVAVTLECRQLNSGLHLDIDPSFRRAFPDGKLRLRSDDGSLDYAYDETRTAFFRPGTVSLSLDDGGFVQTLFSRVLERRQILSVRVSANVGTDSGGISLQVDTSRTRLTEEFVFGGQGAAEIGGAYDVAAARGHAGENGVWVCGYIVGVATGTGKISFGAPFSKNTNLVLGTRASTADKDHCLAVELKAGDIRNGLNLADHPELLGRKVYIRGNLVSAYYGIPGLKAPSEYQF